MQQARRPASSREFTSVDEISRTTGSLFASDPAGDRMRLLRVGTAWRRAVGSHLRTVSRPSSFVSGRLAIEVADPAWKKELDHLAPFILARMAQVMPAEPVAEITFRVRKGGGPSISLPVTVPDGRGTGAADTRRALSSPADSGEPGEPLGAVQDLELRTCLSRVMGRYLARSPRAESR